MRDSRSDDFRLASLQNQYGTATRSYNRSAYKREMNRQIAAKTAQYMSTERVAVALGSDWLTCRCDGQPDPHQAHPMREVLNYRPWFRWEYLKARAARDNGTG